MFLIRVFAISTFIYLFFSFSYAFYQSLEPGKGVLSFNPNPPEHPWLNYFYSAELTISQHPSYISMYVMLSTFICFESWFDYSLEFKKRFFWLILGILLLVSQYFISSRTGIFLGLVMVPLYFIFRFRNYKKKWKVWLVSIILIICVFPVIINNQRVDYLFGKIFEKQVGYERKDDPRLQIWESTINLVKQNLVFGLGIGDARNELAKEYDRIGEEQMAKEKLNTHNQFLEVLLETGIIGLVIIMAIFFSMLKIAVSEKNLLLGLFIMIIFVFFQFETMLYRLAGVTFFSLFSFLLLYLPKRNTDNS
ncbi:MAG TPA: O-antigen ligase family protein [Bacteroidales bacterium]|nr:O-antigen ligase family protein [Bacteroidales bacterium]